MPEADAALLEAEAELQALVIEIETLQALWPAAEPATRRAKIGTCLYSAYERLGELYGVISNAEPRTRRSPAPLCSLGARWWLWKTGRQWNAGWWRRPSLSSRRVPGAR